MRKVADQDVLLVKARRRNDLEVLLLTAPVRALYKTPMMQFYRECSSIALCLALVATMPKHIHHLRSQLILIPWRAESREGPAIRLKPIL